jgi:hypothetical protein
MLEDTKADANNKKVEFVVIERVGETKECATNLRVQLPSIFASAERLKLKKDATA